MSQPPDHQPPGNPAPANTGTRRSTYSDPKFLIAVFALAVVIGISIWIGRDPGGQGNNNGGGNAGMSLPEPGTPADVILISIDTLRADALACYGHPSVATPVLDALAKEGTLFERCYTPYPLTLPAHTTMLSGTTPVYHRVRGNSYQGVPRQGLHLLPESARKAGYATGAFISSSVMDRSSGLNRGFDHYDDDLSASLASGLTLPERSAEGTLKAASKWIAGLKQDQRALTFIHLFDPHFPFWPPDAKARGLKPPVSYQGSDLKPLYMAEVEYVDRMLGIFFDGLRKAGRYDNALIIVTADHGEGLGDRGELTHGYFIYDETTHIPLIVKAPKNLKAPAGQRVSGIVQLMDLVPTIGSAASLKLIDALASQHQGMDLTPYLHKPASAPAEREAYIESHYGFLNAGWGKLRGRRGKDYLAVFASTPELELDAQPGVNLLSTLPADAPQRDQFRIAKDATQRLLSEHFAPNMPSVGRWRDGAAAGVYGEEAKAYYSEGGYGGESKSYPGEKKPYPGEGKSYPGEGKGYPDEKPGYPAENKGYAAEGGQSVPYPGEGMGGGAATRESIADTDNLPSPHARADELLRYQQAELAFSESHYAICLRELDALLESNPRNLMALRLASKAGYELARSLADDQARCRATLKRSAERGRQAVEAARAAGQTWGAFELQSSAMLYDLMASLGNDESLRALNAEAAEVLASNADLPGSLRTRFLRLRYLAAYRQSGSDERKAALGAQLEKELTDADKQQFAALIAEMKGARFVPLAPWER